MYIYFAHGEPPDIAYIYMGRLIRARPSMQIANEQDWNAPPALTNTYKTIWRVMKIFVRFMVTQRRLNIRKSPASVISSPKTGPSSCVSLVATVIL